jgi:hypothetical protein
MEASTEMHYCVILSITAVICSLLLIVFVTIFCSSCHKKDCESRESLEAGERQRLLDGTPTIQTEFRSQGKRVNEPQQAEVENWVVTVSEKIANVSVSLKSGTRVNASDDSGKSHTSKKVSRGQNGEPASSNSKKHGCSESDVNYNNSSDQTSTSTNAKVIPNAKVCSQLQDGGTGAGHRNSGKMTAVN